MFQKLNKTNLGLLLAKHLSHSLRFVLFLVALTGVFLYTRAGTPARVEAATSDTLNFQARLLTSAGALVPDGNYHIEFKLYDDPTAGGQAQGTCSGNCLWMETRTTGNLVTVRNGYLSVNLGSVTGFSGSINWDQNLYVTMRIGGSAGSASWDTEMAPRIKLTAVPYAFRAGGLTKYNGTQSGNLSFNTVANSPNILLPDIAGTNNLLLQSGTTLFTQGSVPFTDSSGRLTQDNTNFFWDNTNKRLGVGTATPQRTLDVNGSGRLTGSGTTVLTGSIDPTASTTVTGVSTLFTTELVVGDRITVSGETRTVTAIASNTSLTVDTAFSDNANDTSPDKLWAELIVRDASSGVDFIVQDNGNVGIGTAAPAAKLQVNGDASAVGLIVQVNVTTPGNALEVRNSSGTVLSGFNAAGELFLRDPTSGNTATIVVEGGTIDNDVEFRLPDVNAGVATICTSANNCNGIGGAGDVYNGGQPSGGLVLGTDTAASTFLQTTNINRLEVTSGGTVSILSGDLRTGVASSLTGDLTLYNSGSAFGAVLRSEALTQQTVFLLPDENTATAEICVKYGTNSTNCAGSGSSVTQSGTNALGQVAYFTSTNNITSQSNYFFDSTNTRLGIGDGSPDYRLEIQGSSGSGYFAISNAADGDIFAVDATGDIAIAGDVVIAAQRTLTLTGGTTAQRPGSPTEGMLYYDTDTDSLLIYSNGKWQADRSEAILVAASNSSQAAKDSADYVADGNTGAAADGDQVQINAALTAAAAAGGKGKVYLFAGTYVADATILIPNNTTLAGAGRGSLIEFGDIDTGDNLIENSDTTTGTGITIHDLRLDGRNDLNTGVQTGISLEEMGDEATDRGGAKISNLWIDNFNGYGIEIDTADNNIFNGNTILGTGSAGFFIRDSVYNTFTGNTIEDSNSEGFFLNNSNNNTFTGNTIQNTVNAGIYISNGTFNTFTGNALYDTYYGINTIGAGTNNNTFTGNTIEASVDLGVYLDDGGKNTVTGNTVSNGANIGIFLDSDNNSLSGNVVQGNADIGMFVGSSNYNTISGNKIHNNGGTTDNNGISLTFSDTNTIISNNITDTQCDTTCYAIAIDSNSDNNYLADNHYSDTDGDDDSSINNAGTGTIFGGQLNGNNFQIQPAGTIELIAATNITGNLDVSGTLNVGSSNQFSVTASGELTFSGVTNDINTASGEDLTVVAGGAGVINLNDTVRIGTLASADTDSYVLCRDASSGQISACDVNGSGDPFIQGGNTFGTQAILGTNDSNSLAFETNNVTKLVIDVSGNLTFQQASTISTTAGALTVEPAAGSNLNINLSTTGDLVVNTDDLYVDTSTGNVGIGDATPENRLTVSGNASVSGSAAIGSNGSVQTPGQLLFSGFTFDTVLDIAETFTDLASTDYVVGISNQMLLDPAAEATSVVVGEFTSIATEATNTEDFAGVIGTGAQITHNSDGTIASVQGGNWYIQNIGDGTINDAQGLNATVVNDVNGTMVNAIGLLAGSVNNGVVTNSVGGDLQVTNSGTATNLKTLRLYIENGSSGTTDTLYGSDLEVKNDGTATDVRGNQNLITNNGTTDDLYGNNITLVNNGDVNNNIIGSQITITNNTDSDVTGLGGFSFNLSNNGDGDLGSVAGYTVGTVTNTGSGSINSLYGVFVNSQNAATASNIGVYVGETSGATTNANLAIGSLPGSGSYSIYNSSTDANLFGGQLIFSGVATDITTATNEDLVVQTNGTGVLTLDSGTTGAVNIATGANAKTITIGNTTGATGVVINTGTGGVNIGDNANTKTIDIGGNDADGVDTVRIATNGTTADTITIGNTSANTAITLNAGTTGGITVSGVVAAASPQALCISSGKLSYCDANTTGAAFLNGGNTFGAQAVLGTNDSNSLAFETNNNTKLILDTTGNLAFQQASNISTTTGALTVTPAAGNNLNINLSTTGDLAVNTDDLYVDTSAGSVGVGTASVASRLHVYQDDTATGNSAGLTVEQDGSGDALVQYLLTGTQRYVTGIDNSDSDSFKIGRGSDWASGVDFVINTGGNVTVGSGAGSTSTTINSGSGGIALTSTAGVTINTGSGTGSISANAGNITFTEVTGTRTLSVQTRTTNVAGTNLTVSAGTAGSGASPFSGGVLQLQGGAAAGTGNANGGNVILTGGTGVGTGVKGLVVVDTATFSAATVQNFTGSASITQANIDTYGTILISANAAGYIATLNDPTNTTAGRLIYVTNTGSFDMTLSVNGGGQGNTVTLKPSTTATMIWNGIDWTAAGASSSTDLQAAYNNTATSAGGAELILNASGGAADGLTIRNNATTPISGGILEVQSAIGTNLFSVNNLGTELAANGGSETSSTWTTNWTTVGSGTVAQSTTSGEFVTGLAGAEAHTTASSTDGIRNNLSGNPVTGSITYQVSFTVKASSAITSTLNVQYSPNGGSTLIPCSAYSSQSVSTSVWTKITCTITTDATAVTNPDLLIRQGDATARDIWIDNLSFIRNDSTTQPSNVQIGGGINGGPITLFTLDRSTAPPVANGDTTYLGSMYYDTTTGRIQCYEADGWGACGSAPDNIITLTPEYTGAVLNGTGVGTLTADFCAKQAGVLEVNTSLCTTTGEARNYYRWTSPQASEQAYKIYVTYKLPTTFKAFTDANTMKLTTLTTDTTLAEAYFRVFKKDVSSGSVVSCGSATEINSSADTWQQTSFGGDETACGFSGGDYIIFEIEVQAEDSESIYIENLDFTYTNT